MFRRLTPLLAAAGIALAGCSTDSPPEVGFYAHGESARIAPAQYCGKSGQECAPPPPNPTGKLEVPPRSPLQISVPGEVAASPWQVAFVYRTADGQERGNRTPVFAPDQQHAYTLRLPPDGTQLEHVEVQQYSGQLTVSPEGELNFGISGSWLLDTA